MMAELMYAGDAGAFQCCTRCGEAKVISDFAIAKLQANGRKAACKACLVAEELARRVANGTVPLGGSFSCEVCSAEYTQTTPSQKYCPDCRPLMKRKNANAANVKYEASRPTRVRNSDADKTRKANWHQANKGRVYAALKLARGANREEVNRKARAYNKTPKRTEWRRAYDAERRLKPKHRLDQRMKSGIRLSLNGGKAGRSWESLVGYTVDDLYTHIEKLFIDGMSWDNIGEWHLDHKRPKASYNYESSDDIEFKECWSLNNLQPLWAFDNMSKGAKWQPDNDNKVNQAR